MRELTKYAEHQGSQIRGVLRGYTSTEIKSLSGFVQSMLNMVMLNCKRFFFEVSSLYVYEFKT